MHNYSNYIDFYANQQVQLPPSRSEILHNSHHTGESARSSTSNQHHTCASLVQLPLSAPSPVSDSHTRFQNRPVTVERTVPNGSNQFLGKPPTYIEAISASNIDPILEPPPSYDSLYGRIIEARNQYKGPMDFLNKIFVLFLSTLSICMIIIGSLFFHRCPQGKYIPVFLMVEGILLIIKLVLRFATRVHQTPDDPATLQTWRSGTQRLINCFILFLFVTGSDYIYRMHKPNYDKSLGLYCDKTLYLMSFWLVTTTYTFLGVIFFSIAMVSIVFQNYQRRFNV
ncbi:uncharacterized protein LOC119071286 [Bradysia coprophila]|uniref:uncharacterized protein LOC119071286 n=1 Tax=Bradysia coprophila TaxID=38358 RepID=UPI00187DD794|nr:uncharacterized protein LOC119071286 [Bradysia coprophila]